MNEQTPAPEIISPDEYEIARFVGIPGEQYTRLIGAMRMVGRCVVPRSLLTEAAKELDEYADDGLSRGFYCQETKEMAVRLRQAASSTNGAQT